MNYEISVFEDFTQFHSKLGDLSLGTVVDALMHCRTRKEPYVFAQSGSIARMIYVADHGAQCSVYGVAYNVTKENIDNIAEELVSKVENFRPGKKVQL